jgi:predicted enzyme related to lactoylglutathione lyase
MANLDHLTLPVADWVRSREWYVRHVGLKIEFEVPERRTAALQDESGFTIFVQQSDQADRSAGVALYFSVVDVESSYRKLSTAGIEFAHPPQKTFWGYGAELHDPDGYTIRLWDQETMKRHDRE